jgi:hypothetical protein
MSARVRLLPVVPCAAAAASLVHGAGSSTTAEEKVQFRYERANYCEVTGSVARLLGIHIDHDLRVMSDVTCFTPTGCVSMRLAPVGGCRQGAAPPAVCEPVSVTYRRASLATAPD